MPKRIKAHESPSFLTPRGQSVVLMAHLVPGSAENRVQGVYGDALKIHVTAPPEKGKANRELLEFLSTILRLPGSSLRLIRGHASHRKLIEIIGIDAPSALARLLPQTPKA